MGSAVGSVESSAVGVTESFAVDAAVDDGVCLLGSAPAQRVNLRPVMRNDPVHSESHRIIFWVDTHDLIFLKKELTILGDTVASKIT